MRKSGIIVLLAVLLFSTGCVVKSPILMFKGKSVKNPNRLPLKAGVVLNAAQRGKISEFLTFTLPIPFYIITAAFPKINEQEFILDSVVQYLKDTELFDFTYSFPFDKRDVDVILEVKINDILAKNSTPYSLIWQLPFLNILTLLGVPQERFSMLFDIRVDVKQPDGTLITSYKARWSDADWVTIYEMPYADYMWYESVFRDVFMKVLDSISAKITSDSEQIISAAETYRRRQK